MITPYLEGERSRNFRRISHAGLIAVAMLGLGVITYLEGERQTGKCVEMKVSEMNEKRRLKGASVLRPLDIQNIEKNCRTNYYRRIIGL